MRIYLAGPSAELDRVRAAAAEIEAAGHAITQRWWDVIERDREGQPTDTGTPREVLVRAWLDNVEGIHRAQRVVALALSGGGLSSGTREEVAFATGLYRDVVIVGDPYPSLAGCAQRCVATVAEALT